MRVAEQRGIVAELDALQAEVDALMRKEKAEITKAETLKCKKPYSNARFPRRILT